MRYTLIEYSYLSGCGKQIGVTDRISDFNYANITNLNTYAIYDGSTCLAEFEGWDVNRVCAWFAENPSYDGSAGCRAWRGE